MNVTFRLPTAELEEKCAAEAKAQAQADKDQEKAQAKAQAKAERDAAAAATRHQGTIMGIALQWLLDPGAFDLEASGDLAVEMLMRSLEPCA